MYSQEAIGVLKNRIGWYPAIAPTPIVITNENQISVSGRYFNGFNPIATVENIKASIYNKDADDVTLNVELDRLRNEAVLDVLQKVYNTNSRATAAVTNSIISMNYALDYSGNIILNQAKFDEAIGLSGTIKALELIQTTQRSNLNTHNARIDMENLKNAFHGSFAATGQVISKGLYAQYREAAATLIKVLFPVQYTSPVVLNKTHLW